MPRLPEIQNSKFKIQNKFKIQTDAEIQNSRRSGTPELIVPPIGPMIPDVS
jgi:hypothetical protein